MSTHRSSSRIVRPLAGVFLLGALACIASCDCESCSPPQTVTTTTPTVGSTPQTGETPSVPAPASESAPDAVYVVRGIVVQVPDAADATSEFRVRHEAIDNFKNSSGEVVGMGAMEMSFPLKEVSLVADVKPGDVLELTFEDFYKPRRMYFVTKIVKLASDTALEFREARPVK